MQDLLERVSAPCRRSGVLAKPLRTLAKQQAAPTQGCWQLQRLQK